MTFFALLLTLTLALTTRPGDAAPEVQTGLPASGASSSGVERAGRKNVGEPAPSFALASTSGRTVRLGDFKNRKLILAFYPKSFTGGCTKEMSAFRDLHPQFTEKNATIIGVSMDSKETQARFAESLKLPFELLADREGKTAAAYGVKGALFARRTTFVIDEAQKIIAVFEGRDAIDPSAALAACR
jgi:peroxiredoxin